MTKDDLERFKKFRGNVDSMEEMSDAYEDYIGDPMNTPDRDFKMQPISDDRVLDVSYKNQAGDRNINQMLQVDGSVDERKAKIEALKQMIQGRKVVKGSGWD